MLIECYLFSEITQQIGHTYYSGLNHYHKILHFNLNDYSPDKIPLRMFIYKVKVDSNDVYNLFQTGVRVVKYQIVEEVPLSDFIKEAELFKKTKSELTSILNGTMSKDKILNIYEYSIKKGAFNLTKLQILRLHAVLAQTKYDLPTLIANSQNFRFLPLIEYYGKNYEIAPNLTPYAKNFLIHEAMRGAKRFEYIENKDTEELVKNSSGLLDLIRCRKLTQAQFEEICQVISKLNYREVKDLIHYSLYANYEIPQECYNLFMPYIVLKDHSYINELKKEHFTNTFTKSDLLTIGYKTKNCVYEGFRNSEIIKAKEILKSDNYKYIDLEV
jgi:hypothetical protein